MAAKSVGTSRRSRANQGRREEVRPAKGRRDAREGGARDPGRPAAAPRPVRRRRQEDDQAGQEARLRHLWAAQFGHAVGGGHLRADRGHPGDDERDGHQRRRDRGSRSRGGRRGARGTRRGGDRGRRTGRGRAEDAGQVRSQGAGRAHRRSGAHVSARNGLGRAALPRGRDRHRQAHRGRPRSHDRRAVRKPADLPGHHHLARRAERGQGLPARHHRSRSDLCRPRRQERGRRAGVAADANAPGAAGGVPGFARAAAAGRRAAVGAARRHAVQAARRNGPLRDGEEAALEAAIGEGELDEDDLENSMSLAAIEAELKPKVLETFDNIADTYKRLRRLQDQDIQNRLKNDNAVAQRRSANTRSSRKRSSPR